MALAELHGRLQIAELRAAIEAPPRQPYGHRALVLEESGDGIGELDLAARAWRDLGEQIEDARGKDIAPYHRQVRGRVRRLRLLDDAMDAGHVALHAFAGDDAVALRLVA